MTPYVQPQFVEGDKNNRKYLDAVGKPLKVGDTVIYCTARSCSVYMRFAIITEIVDLAAPVFLAAVGPDHARIDTWDLAYKLKTKTLERDKLTNIFRPPSGWRENPSSGKYETVAQSLDDIKTNTIHRIDRVVKADFQVEL